MNFVDEAIISVQSGDGGRGCLSFRREKFIERGCRVPIVKAQFPHIAEVPLRQLYRNIHGNISKRGLTPSSVMAVNKSYTDILHANFYYQIYLGLGGSEVHNTLNAEIALNAYDQYSALNVSETQTITFTQAWYVARDLRSKIIDTKYCRQCNVSYLYNLQSMRWRNCPYCREITQTETRIRRAEEEDQAKIKKQKKEKRRILKENAEKERQLRRELRENKSRTQKSNSQNVNNNVLDLNTAIKTTQFGHL